jgi:pimeloyl-ACP methyl ester carboxylesterase
VRRTWRRIAGHGGVPIATERTSWGDGSPTTVVAAHATGFCKEVFRPVVAELVDLVPAGDVIATDQRGHGDSGAIDPPLDWWDLGRDLAAVVDGAQGLVGIGHSGGSAALVMAELLAPGTFRRLLLVEPILLPPPYEPREPAIMRSARRRRRHFASLEEAKVNFRGKTVFAAWDPRALDAYVKGGLRPDGAGWTLKCTPEAEVETYRTASLHAAWERLGEVRSNVTVVAGSESDTHPRGFAEETARRFLSADAVIVPDVSHTLVMERPELMARYLAEALETGSGWADDAR